MQGDATVYYNSQLKDSDQDVAEMNDYDMFLKEWIMLTAKNGTVYRETKWWKERNVTLQHHKNAFIWWFLNLFMGVFCISLVVKLFRKSNYFSCRKLFLG